MDCTLPAFRPTRLVRSTGKAREFRIIRVVSAEPERRRRPLALLIPVVWVIALNLMTVPDLTQVNRILASAISVICWIPFAVHLWKREQGIPFMPVLCLAHAACYAWVVFLNPDYLNSGLYAREISDDLLTQSLALTLAGVCCLLAGYYLAPERLLAAIPRVKVPDDPGLGIHAAVVAGGLAMLAAAVPDWLAVSAQFSAFVTISSQLFSFSMAMLFYYYLQGRLGPYHRWFLWAGLVPMRLTSTLASGAIAQVAIDMMLMLGTYWLARKQWPWKACLIFGLCIVPLWGVKAEYRNLAWGSSDMSNFEKARAFVSLAGAGFKGQEAFVADSSETVIQRLDQTATFCFVLRLTPTIVPYWGGDSYGTLAWAVIPRFLYPDKPGKFVGQDFGHRYRLLSKQDDSTSYNCPQLVEMYANFGPWGVIFGMALLGLICRGIYYALSDPNGGDSTCMIALIIFTRLCDIESDFSMVFGGLLLNVAALVLAIRLLQARSIKLQTDALPGV